MKKIQTPEEKFRLDAAEGKDNEIKKAVRKSRSFLESTGPSKTTALMFAVKKKRIKTVELLLSLGADPEKIDKDGNTINDYISAEGYDCEEIKEIIKTYYKNREEAIGLAKKAVFFAQKVFSEERGDDKEKEEEHIKKVQVLYEKKVKMAYESFLQRVEEHLDNIKRNPSTLGDGCDEVKYSAFGAAYIVSNLEVFFKTGNRDNFCGVRTAMAAAYLINFFNEKEKSDLHIERVEIRVPDADHTFLIVNKDVRADKDKFEEYGASAFFLDAFTGDIIFCKEFLKNSKNLKSSITNLIDWNNNEKLQKNRCTMTVETMYRHPSFYLNLLESNEELKKSIKVFSDSFSEEVADSCKKYLKKYENYIEEDKIIETKNDNIEDKKNTIFL